MTTTVDPLFRPVVDAFAGNPRVTSGMMMSSFGLKVEKKIFVMFGRGRFVAKLPRERVMELVREQRGQHFDPGHGRLMKEWIAMDSRPDTWIELAREAYEFVGGASE